MDECSNTVAFSKLLEPAFRSVMHRYPGSGNNPHGLAQIIERTERGQGDVRYYVLRTYADHVGIPTGLLLMLSHVIGDLSRGRAADEIRKMLLGLEAALRELTAIVETEGAASLIQWAAEGGPDNGRYNVNISALTKVIDSYKDVAGPTTESELREDPA